MREGERRVRKKPEITNQIDAANQNSTTRSIWIFLVKRDSLSIEAIESDTGI